MKEVQRHKKWRSKEWGIFLFQSVDGAKSLGKKKKLQGSKNFRYFDMERGGLGGHVILVYSSAKEPAADYQVERGQKMGIEKGMASYRARCHL